MDFKLFHHVLISLKCKAVMIYVLHKHNYSLWSYEAVLQRVEIAIRFNSVYVLLKALPPVCMKYTAQGESRVANIARGEALYLSRDSHQELYTFIQTKWQCFKCFIVFYT